MTELLSEELRWLPALSLLAESEGKQESEVLVRFLQPIWVGGRINNAIAKSKIDLELSQTELLRIQREMLENTAVAYADLLGLEARIGAAEMISRRKKGLVSSGADVQLARSRLSQALLLKEELLGLQQRAVTDLIALTQEQVPVLAPVPGLLTDLPVNETIESQVLPRKRLLFAQLFKSWPLAFFFKCQKQLGSHFQITVPIGRFIVQGFSV